MRFLIAALLLLPTLVYAGQGGEYVRAYLGEWLKEHGYTDYTLNEKGIHLKSVNLTLNGEIYGINELKKGELYSAETQLSALFSGGRKLDDFAAGVGKTPEEAFLDSLNNFCLTTLHPIYAELIDKKDTHVRKESWMLSHKMRNIFLTDWGQRGEIVEKQHLDKVKKIINEQLTRLNLTNDIHWVKLVVSNVDGKLETVVLTVDGLQYDELNKQIASYSWPSSKQFYMVKLFFVIGKA